MPETPRYRVADDGSYKIMAIKARKAARGRARKDTK